MWSKIIKSIILAIFARRVVWPLVLVLIFAWVVIGLPIANGIVGAYRDYNGICVESSFKNCDGR